MIPIVSLALRLAQFAPQIIGLVSGAKAEEVATQVVGIAQTVAGADTPDAALAAMQRDPDVALQFQRVIADREIELARIDADVLKAQFGVELQAVQAVNATMQAEAKSEHWPQYSWRPFVGFCFGALALVTGGTAALAYLSVMFFGSDPAMLAHLPGLLGAEAAVMATMSPVVGVASWHRGRMQVQQAAQGQ